MSTPRKKQPDPRETLQLFEDHLSKERLKFIMAIDPGVNGAFAFLTTQQYAVVNIPTLERKVGNKKRQAFDFAEIWQTLEPFLTSPLKRNLSVIIEKAAPNAGGGKKDTASTAFMVGVGGWMYELLFESLEITRDYVVPRSWKSKMQLLSKDKEDSRVKAQTLFPKAPLWRKEDHNRAEALLLAKYASLYVFPLT